MKRRFPLATVLRVRSVQEDLAQAGVVRARGVAAVADAAAGLLEEQLRTHRLSGGPASAWVATAQRGVVLAADAALARAGARAAEADVTAALGAWADARAARRGVERLSERHTAAVRAEDDRLEQRNLDERAVRR